MSSVLLAAVALVVFSPGAEGGAGERVVRLQVEPMAAPRRALEYQLLPEAGELIPGNAAQEYQKCFMEQHEFFFGPHGTAERARRLATPLAELAAAKLREYGGQALRQADRAARMEGVDWQVVSLIQEGEVESPPAELGPLQTLALALNVRLRAEAAERRYGDAVRTAKSMFALGRHLGEYPAGSANQVGLWVVHRAVGGLEEMVQQPACPNLYWALTALPCPLVDLRRGLQGDRVLAEASLRSIRADGPMTAAEIEACVGRLSGLIGFAREQAGRAPWNLRARLTARANDPEHLVAARQRLLEAGRAAAVVHDSPPLQVVLLDEKRGAEIKLDARLARAALPFRGIDDARSGESGDGDEYGDGLFDDLLPQVVALRRSQAVLEQEIALLRHVEALRLHAAGRSGRLPATLAEVVVPLPDDPFTGKPFDYQVEGAVAHLRGGLRQSGHGDASANVHFEVVVRP